MTIKPTTEERREKWWKRHPLPFYVRSRNRYGESTYLIRRREDLTEVAMKILKEMYENKEFGDDSWFFFGTYEEYVQKKIGLSIPVADALLLGNELVAEELKRLKEHYLGLKEGYQQEAVDIETINDVRRVLNGDTDPFSAVQILLLKSVRQFDISQFDNVVAEPD